MSLCMAPLPVSCTRRAHTYRSVRRGSGPRACAPPRGAHLLRRKAGDHGLRGDVERREDLDAEDEQLRARAARSAVSATQPG